MSYNTCIEQLVSVIIPHHSSCELHTELLKKCVQSIRNIYKKIRIIICKTSTTIIPDTMINEFNLEVINTPQDGSTVVGAIYNIVKDKTILNYIIVFDSMHLLNALPNDILSKNLYYIWYFQGAREDHHERISHFLNISNFNEEEKKQIYNMYNSYSDWVGCFGPLFGGKREGLELVFNKLNLERTIHEFNIPRDIMCFERFLPCIFSFLNLYDKNQGIEILAGDIHLQPKSFDMTLINYSLEEIKELCKVNNYDNYFFKLWLSRHTSS